MDDTQIKLNKLDQRLTSVEKKSFNTDPANHPQTIANLKQFTNSVAAGVTSVATGAGISTNNPSGNITLTNTGVTKLSAGTGIFLTSTTGNITISTTPVPTPIARDATGNFQATTTSPFTFTHVCTGSQLLLVVTVSISTSSDLVTSITYNGAPMTRQSAQLNWGGSGNSVWFYYILSPTVGSHSVSVSFSGGGNLLCTAFSASYSGVTQNGSFPDASATNTSASASSLTVTPTVVKTGCWLVGIFNASNPPSAGAGTSEVVGAGFNVGIFDSNQQVGTGSQSLVTTFIGGSAAAGSVISIPAYP